MIRRAQPPIEDVVVAGDGVEVVEVIASTPAMPWRLVALMGGAGTTHFTNPGFYDAIVPKWLPGKARTWTYVSGVAELACAGLMLIPRTRRLGGAATFLTILAVWPANWQVAVDGGMPEGDGPLNTPAAAWARVPMQLPMLLGAWRLARS